jgi:hypothetical protein
MSLSPRNRPPGFMALPAAFIVVALLTLGAMVVFGRALGFGLSLLLGLLPPILIASALFLTIRELPRDRPRLRVAAMVLLIVGGIAILWMTPFGALYLAAQVCEGRP